MFERFTDEARALVPLAVEHAIRLGHRYVGGEHILLAAVTAGQPASAVLCAHGVTPELVEEEIVRRVGLGAGAGLFGGLDKDALATIGIDLELTLREAVALHDSHIGVEHVALALTTIKQGLVPQILSQADAPAAALRTAILDQYRRAS